MSTYRGFSTLDFANVGVLNNTYTSNTIINQTSAGTYGKQLRFVANNSSLVLTDIQLVEQNLINHIFTRKGERIRMPNFGTRIPIILYEPLDNNTISIIEEDIKAVIAYDPRVQLQFLKSIPQFDRNILSVVVSLYYIEFKLSKEFNLRLEFKG